MALSLPDDIMFQEILIRDRVTLKLLGRLRCVCKLWKSLFSDSDFVQPLLNQSISQHSDDDYLIRQWPGGLAILSRTDLCEYPIDNIPHPVPCPDRVLLVGSINGLICLVRFSEPDIRFLLWNPVIHVSKQILLPEHCRSYPKRSRCLFGFSWDAVANDYKVLAKYSSQAADIYSSTTNCWSSVAVDPPLLEAHHCPSVIVKGNPYWRCFERNVILKFEARNNEFTYMRFPRATGKMYHLVNMNDCLARIEYTGMGADRLDVYQFNEDQNNTWCKMFTINNIPRNVINSGPTCFKSGGDIVCTGSSRVWHSESNKIKNLPYVLNKYFNIHGCSYTPSLLVLEGMKPLHLSERSLTDPGIGSKGMGRLLTTILVGITKP